MKIFQTEDFASLMGGQSHFYRLRLRSCSNESRSGSGSVYSADLRIRLLFRLWLQSSMQP